MSWLSKTEKKLLLLTGVFFVIGTGAQYLSKTGITGFTSGGGIFSKATHEVSGLYAGGNGYTGVEVEGRYNVAKGVEKINVEESSKAKKVKSKSTDKTASVQNPISLNMATASELMKIKGVGPVMAERIVTYRQENGLFSDLVQLKKVKGIGEKKYQKLFPYLKIEENGNGQ